MAITDHECISGHLRALRYYNKIKKDHPDFKLILGNEIYLCRDGLNSNNFNSGIDKYYHFILLAKDEIGHKQIRELSTRAWNRSYKTGPMRRVPTYYSDLVQVIGENKGHIIGMTACLGGCLATQLEKLNNTSKNYIGDKELVNFKRRIVNWCIQIENIFGKNNFYFEMQPSDTIEQTFVNKQIVSLSKQLSIPYVITTDTHYLKESDRGVHRNFLKTKDGDREVDSFYATTFMMDTANIKKKMKMISDDELYSAFDTINEIAEKCTDYSLEHPLHIPELIWEPVTPISNEEMEYYISEIPHLKEFVDSKYKSDTHLAKIIINQIQKRADLQNKETYDAINTCLDMTWVSSEKNNARWSAYLLNLQKIVQECWNSGTLVGAGRGSGVGFILLYILNITQINPLKENTKLYPWRFLNPDRVSVLDF